MQVVIDNSDLLTKAHKRFKTFTKNDELVELYEARQKYRMDRDTAIGYAEMKGIEKGRKEGIQKGREEGIEKRKMETAREFKRLGVSVDVIIKATGLIKSEIEGLE